MQHPMTPPSGAVVPPGAPRPHLQAYLSTQQPGLSVDTEYVVLPRAVLARMEPAWQAALLDLLQHLHRVTQQAPWPLYQVTPSQVMTLSELNEPQLAAAGVIAEIDGAGALIYRETRSGNRIHRPEARQVLVPCEDLLVPGALPTSPPAEQRNPEGWRTR